MFCMIRLLFAVPVSNAKLERIFSKLKHVKRLENILRIMEKSSNRETFGPISVIKKWSIHKFRCTIEEKGSRSYKTCSYAKVNVKSLSDNDSYDEEKNILRT